MEYRVKGIPETGLNSNIFDALMSSPEMIAAKPPVPSRDAFANRLGFALSNEARGAMSPEELAAIEGARGVPDESRLIQWLAAIASVLGPEQLRPAMFSRTPMGKRIGNEAQAGEMRIRAEGRAKDARELGIKEDKVASSQARIAQRLEGMVAPLFQKALTGSISAKEKASL